MIGGIRAIDVIEIQGLTVDTLIGVYAWERQQPQPITLDLVIGPLPDVAFQRDHLSDTIDYASLIHGLTDFIAQQRYQLLETLAERIWCWVRDHYDVQYCQLTLYKSPADLPQIKRIALRIERSVR